MRTNTILKTFLILIIGTAITFTSCKKDNLVPTPEPPVVVANVKIGAGGGHSYILKPDGTLWGVGWNDFGQLGTGNTTNVNNWIKITDNVKAVSAGYQYSLILKNDNTVWATGINGSAQLGDGTKANQPRLIQVATGAIKIYASLYTSFIIKADNTLWGAGSNYIGMLGVNNETTAESLSFTQIDTDVKSVANGANHTLFLKMDNTVWAAGANNSGQLGNTALGVGTFMKVKIADNVKDIAAGRLHSLVLKNDNTLWGAGFNSHGQLATAAAPGGVAGNLTQITTDVKAMQIAANGLNSYIIKNDNTLWGCGWNQYGQLANGNNTDQATFQKISDNVVDFSPGYAHILLLKTDKTIWASGADDIGQVGNGTMGAHQNTLVKVIIP
jgi:alpha-tubulin suppressor-like RCC1 family protein